MPYRSLTWCTYVPSFSNERRRPPVMMTSAPSSCVPVPTTRAALCIGSGTGQLADGPACGKTLWINSVERCADRRGANEWSIYLRLKACRACRA
eukprot:291091-Prymnesium_polylepis.2